MQLTFPGYASSFFSTISVAFTTLWLENGGATIQYEDEDVVWHILYPEVTLYAGTTWPHAFEAQIYGPYIAVKMPWRRGQTREKYLEVRSWVTGEFMWVRYRRASQSTIHALTM